MKNELKQNEIKINYFPEWRVFKIKALINSISII